MAYSLGLDCRFYSVREQTGWHLPMQRRSWLTGDPPPGCSLREFAARLCRELDAMGYRPKGAADEPSLLTGGAGDWF